MAGPRRNELRFVRYLDGAPLEAAPDLSRWTRPTKVEFAIDDTWIRAAGGEWVESTEIAERLLHDFLKLTDGVSDGVLAFCAKWGMVELCQHGLPSTHRPCRPFLSPSGPDQCHPASVPDGTFESGDPVDAYVRYARSARALIAVSREVHAERAVPTHLWDGVDEISLVNVEPIRIGQRTKERALEVDRLRFLAAVESWLELGDVRLQVAFARRTPTIVFGGGTLFSALAHRLALAALRLGGTFSCTSCGTAFVPEKRRPRPNDRAYCSECQEENRPARDRSRRHREKKKASGSWWPHGTGDLGRS